MCNILDENNYIYQVTFKVKAAPSSTTNSPAANHKPHKRMSNPINRLALGLLFTCSLPAIAQPANVNQATNEFQPLPRLQVTPDQDKRRFT